MQDTDFYRRFNGAFSGVLRWPQLDELWAVVRAAPEGWYLYHVGEDVPDAPATPEALERFVAEVDALLREEHEEDYCGIVYADSRDAPTMIKIYDPGNLGVACGPSKGRVLPRWLMSRVRPGVLARDYVTPANRRRWWRRLFG